MKLNSLKVVSLVAAGVLLGVMATIQFDLMPQTHAALSETTPALSGNTVPASAPAPTPMYNPDIITALNNSFISIAEKAKPSVVTILTNKVIKSTGNPHQQSPFNDFFDFFRMPDMPRERRMSGQGSGVIVSRDGYILTNNHVVDDADEIQVTLLDGKKMEAKVIGTDQRTDIAVVKVDAKDLQPIEFGNSDQLRVGEWVMAIGSPLRENLASTVSAGIVSATGRQLGLASVENFIQTDAAINPGNSGGAMIDLHGQLVGINTAIVSQSGGFQGIGFAVPVNLAKWVMDSLIKNGKVTYGYLGILPEAISETIAEHMGLESTKGALVSQVEKDTPAEKAGLEAGDVILKINNQAIHDDTHLRKVVGTLPPGTTIKMDIIRDGKEKEVKVTLGEYPEELLTSSNKTDEDNSYNKLGIEVANLTPDIARRFSIRDQEAGVVITDIDRTGEAYDAGLRVGDLILSANKTKIETVGELDSIISKLDKGDTILLYLKRDNRRFFSAIKIK